MPWVEFETKDHTFQRMVRAGSELLQICGRLRILNSKSETLRRPHISWRTILLAAIS